MAIVPRKLLATANQISLMSVYGTVPIAAAAFALLSAADRVISGQSTATTNSVNTAIVIALLLNTLSFLVSATTVFLSRRDIPVVPAQHEQEQGIFSLIREGVSFVRTHPLIRGLYIGIVGAFAGGGLTVGVAQLWVFTLDAGAAGYALMFGAVFTGLADRAAHRPADAARVQPQSRLRAVDRRRRNGAGGELTGPRLHPGARTGHARRAVRGNGVDHRLHAHRLRGRGPVARPHVRVRHLLGADQPARVDRGRPGARRLHRLARPQDRPLPPRLHRAGADPADRRRDRAVRQLLRDHAFRGGPDPAARRAAPPGAAGSRPRRRPGRSADHRRGPLRCDGRLRGAARRRGTRTRPDRRRHRRTHRLAGGPPGRRNCSPETRPSSRRRRPCCPPPIGPSTSRR